MNRLPNRKERRAMNKANKRRMTLQDFALAYAVQGLQKGEDISWLQPYLPTDAITHKDNWDLFPDGTKAKINYEGVTSRPPKYLSTEFRDWIEENKEEEFTINRDMEDAERKGLVSLRYIDESKDTEQSKLWLFDLYTDLLVWSDLENTYVNPQKVEDLINELDNVKQSLALCDTMDLEAEEQDYQDIEKIRQAIDDHEKGAKFIADPVEWQNMDSILQNIILKTTDSSEDDIPQMVEAPAEEPVEENKETTEEGGED